MPIRVPLFPLHTVLAPGIVLPLHVFEARYRVMVRRCLDTSSPFGVVLIREGSEVAPREGEAQELAIAGVGTLAEIREASRYEDGRWDVLAVGTSRFLVRQVDADQEPYLVAEVEPYPDEPGEPDETEELAGRVTRRFVDYLRLLQPRDGETADPIDVRMEVEVEVEDGDDADDADEAGEDAGHGLSLSEEPFADPEAEPLPLNDPDAARAALRIPDDPSALSFLLTGILQIELDRKQALLEAPSAEERLQDIDELLDRELDLLGRRLAPFSVDRSGLGATTN